MLERIEYIGVCPSSIVSYIPNKDISPIMTSISEEGLGESFHVLPYSGGLRDQPHGIIQAFSLIRATRNELQAKELKSQREQSSRNNRYN